MFRQADVGATNRWRGYRVRLGLTLGAVLLGSLAAGVGQVAPASQPGVTPATGGRTPFGVDPMGAPTPTAGPNPRTLEHMREDERHKRLLADAAKLVELTNELKAEVDKASKDELSVDVVRKAAEIEKLARDVKERMRS